MIVTATSLSTQCDNVMTMFVHQNSDSDDFVSSHLRDYWWFEESCEPLALPDVREDAIRRQTRESGGCNGGTSQSEGG